MWLHRCSTSGHVVRRAVLILPLGLALEAGPTTSTTLFEGTYLQQRHSTYSTWRKCEQIEDSTILSRAFQCKSYGRPQNQTSLYTQVSHLTLSLSLPLSLPPYRYSFSHPILGTVQPGVRAVGFNDSRIKKNHYPITSGHMYGCHVLTH